MVTSTFASTISKLIYGMNIHEDDESNYIKTAEIMVGAAAEVGNPGSFLVDLLPFMKYIPAWFPGAGWKKKAKYWREIGKYFVHAPWTTVEEQLVGKITLFLGQFSQI